MHSLCKTLFFTGGSVGLLMLVFIWSALHYGLFSLNHLIDALLKYKFAGYTFSDYFNLPIKIGEGEKIYYLKMLITIVVACGSTYLIILSYLPRISWQLRSLSLGISIPLLALLGLFWVCLIEGSEVILKQERLSIFVFTVITYFLGIISMWYAIRPSRKRSLGLPSSEASKPISFTTENKKIEAVEELDSPVLADKTEQKVKDEDSSNSEEFPKDDSKEEESVDTSDESKLRVAAEAEPNQQIEDEVDEGLVNQDQTREEVAPQEPEELIQSVETLGSADEEDTLSVKSKDDAPEGNLPDSTPSIIAETRETRAV